MGRATSNFFWPLGIGSKGQISFNFNFKVNFKDFYSKLCVCSHKWKKTYQTSFLFCHLGHALGVGLGLHRGQNQIMSCCLSVMLSLPKPLEEIQPNLVCELLTWMGRPTSNCFGRAPWGPGEGSKGQIFNFNYKVNFKDFIPNFVCYHKWRYKTYQTSFLFCRLGHAIGVGLGGT